MELKIRVPGARRGGTGIMNASGQGPAPGPGRRPGDLGRCLSVPRVKKARHFKTSVTAGTLLFNSRPEDGFRTVTPGLMPWASCCNHCIQLRLMVHLAPTENAATLKVIIEQKRAGEQTLGATSRDKAQTDSE